MCLIGRLEATLDVQVRRLQYAEPYSANETLPCCSEMSRSDEALSHPVSSVLRMGWMHVRKWVVALKIKSSGPPTLLVGMPLCCSRHIGKCTDRRQRRSLYRRPFQSKRRWCGLEHRFPPRVLLGLYIWMRTLSL